MMSKVILAEGQSLGNPKPTSIPLKAVPDGTVFKGKLGASGPDDLFFKGKAHGDNFVVFRLSDLTNRWTEVTDSSKAYGHYLVENYRVVDITITVHPRS